MKECISERDHYRMFPRKSYPLDDECDLIEIESVETAYCLCRHDDFCNGKSISDQFIAFEEVFMKFQKKFILLFISITHIYYYHRELLYN